MMNHGGGILRCMSPSGKRSQRVLLYLVERTLMASCDCGSSEIGISA